ETVERAEDHLLLRYRSQTTNLLRVAVPMYPGWHASFDGAELPIVTVDHAFIGVVVPPGAGELRLWYAPRYFWPAAALSVVAVLVTLALVLGWPRRPGLTK